MKHKWDKIWYSTDMGLQTYRMEQCSNCGASRTIEKIKTALDGSGQRGTMGPYTIWNGEKNCYQLSKKEKEQQISFNKLQEEWLETKLKYESQHSLLDGHYYWIKYNGNSVVGKYRESYGWIIMPEYEEETVYYKSISECQPIKEIIQ